MRTPDLTTRALRSLLRWYRLHQRDLPWRHTRDPYRILVSEVMLQQTRVSRVIDFYQRWIKQFPDWKSLARAPTDKLLHAWAGLGYNRRALQLRDAARQVVATHVPRSIAEWRTLKGVGPYTAAAVYGASRHVRSIAIDTNVRRVAGRFLLGIPYSTLQQDERLSQVLERDVPKDDRYWVLPQALMDLGNSHCTVRDPSCATCPLRAYCPAAKKFATGRVAHVPIKRGYERVHAGKYFPDRIYRGRILALVRKQERVSLRSIGPRVDDTYNASRDRTWIDAMVMRLVRDRLITVRERHLMLPR